MCLFERRWFGSIPVLWVGYGVGFIFWEGGSRVLPIPSSSTASGQKGSAAPHGPGRAAFHRGFLHGHLLSSSHHKFLSEGAGWLCGFCLIPGWGPNALSFFFFTACQIFAFLPNPIMPGMGIFCSVSVSWQGALLVLLIVGCPDAKPSPTEERKGSCVVTTA